LIEAAIPFTVRHIDLSAGAHMQPPFIAINPAGKVPTLIDHNFKPSLVIHQSNAIIQYADAMAPGTLAPSGIGPIVSKRLTAISFLSRMLLQTVTLHFFSSVPDSETPRHHSIIE
jgi:glutathione S-transferase